MTVIIDKDTKLVVQGITGYQGTYHSKAMQDFGTNVVAGVTPGKAGGKVNDIPVFDTVAEAVAMTGANASCVFVPAAGTKDAVMEALDAGLGTIVVVTEHVPVHDAIHFVAVARSRGVTLVGPNCPGVISPGKAKVGIMPGSIHAPGRVGVVSRSGTLTYEIVHHLTRSGIGQSTCIGIGGDPVAGTNLLDALELFGEDEGTDAVVLIGEIGGSDEEEAASLISRGYPKKVAAFIAGRTAPPGKRMGHAGAIVSGGTGTAAEKVAAFKAVGVEVAATPGDIVDLVKKMLPARRR